jgi:hypothetical protein
MFGHTSSPIDHSVPLETDVKDDEKISKNQAVMEQVMKSLEKVKVSGNVRQRKPIRFA